MTRLPISLATDDLSAFSRALSRQLGPDAPAHLSLMNMLARAAGYQNLQHMRAVQAAGQRMAVRMEPPPVDHRLVERTLHQFDDRGRLIRWPSRRAVQTLALQALWSVLPAQQVLTEAQVNAALRAEHLFDDPATLRRTMISCRLLTRTVDGREYRRIEQAPSPAALALMTRLKSRRQVRTTP